MLSAPVRRLVRERECRLWKVLAHRYKATHFAVVPTKESNPVNVVHLFSSGRINNGNCRWYAFGSEEDQQCFLRNHPNARSCDNPVKE